MRGTQEAEAGEFLRLTPACSTKHMLGWPQLREILSQKHTNNNKRRSQDQEYRSMVECWPCMIRPWVLSQTNKGKGREREREEPEPLNNLLQHLATWQKGCSKSVVLLFFLNQQNYKLWSAIFFLLVAIHCSLLAKINLYLRRLQLIQQIKIIVKRITLKHIYRENPHGVADCETLVRNG